jgi:hypothetical protein
MKIEDRVNSDDLRIEIGRSKPVPAERNIRNWIPGTMSQSIKYFDRNNALIAKAHRYLRPDGLLAASGMADPKRVLLNGTYYILDDPNRRSGDSAHAGPT